MNPPFVVRFEIKDPGFYEDTEVFVSALAWELKRITREVLAERERRLKRL